MPAVSLFALTPASWNCSPAACSTLRHGILGVRSLAWGISMDPQNFTRLVPFFWASYVWRSTNYWAAPGLISSFNRFTSSSARVRSALAGHPENALKSASDPGYSSNFPWKNLETLGLPRSKKMEMEARSSSRIWISQHRRDGPWRNDTSNRSSWVMSMQTWIPLRTELVRSTLLELTSDLQELHICC